MNKSSELRIKMQKVITIIVCWFFIGLLITLYDHFTVHSIYSSGPADDYTIAKSLGIHLGGALLGSVLGSTFLVFYINEKYKQKPYWQSLVAATAGIYVIIAFILAFVGIVTTMLESGGTLLAPGSKDELEPFVALETQMKNMLVWGSVVLITQFTLQVNDKFGQGTLWNIIRGKYHFPQKEKRIFMFVDMQSSTTIAERLGNERYHALLKDFFADITDAIIYNKGQIYQYVGDEVVITWDMKNGLDANHCIRCFFDMREAIQAKADYYRAQYGVVPDFKAGMHYGEVVAGEIGIIKKDITFSGDVLNTAARLQEKCKEFGVHILSSDELLEELPEQNLFEKISIGSILFRGKEQRINISTLQLR